MTVKELIERLQVLRPDAEVWVVSYDTEVERLDHIELEGAGNEIVVLHGEH